MKIANVTSQDLWGPLIVPKWEQVEAFLHLFNLSHDQAAFTRAISLYRQHGPGGLKSLSGGRMSDEFLQAELLEPAKLALQQGHGWSGTVTPPGQSKGQAETLQVQRLPGKERLFSLNFGPKDTTVAQLSEALSCRRALLQAQILIATKPSGEGNKNFFFDFAVIAPAIAKTLSWPPKDVTDILLQTLTRVTLTPTLHTTHTWACIPTKTVGLQAQVRMMYGVGERFVSGEVNAAGAMLDHWTINGTTVCGPRPTERARKDHAPCLLISIQSSQSGSEPELITDDRWVKEALRLRGHMLVELQSLVK